MQPTRERKRRVEFRRNCAQRSFNLKSQQQLPDGVHQSADENDRSRNNCKASHSISVTVTRDVPAAGFVFRSTWCAKTCVNVRDGETGGGRRTESERKLAGSSPFLTACAMCRSARRRHLWAWCVAEGVRARSCSGSVESS